MKKSVKIILITSVTLVTVLAVTVMALFIPRGGKQHTEIWSATQVYDVDSVASLEKSENADFKILLMTDIQLWSNAGDNKKTFALMDKLVEQTTPSLIVLPGDNVSGLTTDALLRQLIKKMDSYGIPWAPVFGNHDAEGNATLQWQADRFAESEYCLFQRGPSNLYGVGNYFVNVRQNDEIIYSLCLMDNGRYFDYGKAQYEENEDGSYRPGNKSGGKKEMYLGYEQIAWYEWNMKGTAESAGKTVPSMSFTHFAAPEFRTAIKTLATLGADEYYYVPQELGYGYCKYLPGVAYVNSGFFDKAKALGLTHMFFGHDHENTASIAYNGVTMTYGLKTGCSPRYWNDAKEYGGTVITIDADARVSIANHVMETLA